MKFDLLVIGGGAAGLVSSGFAGKIGLNVALVSDGHPGGECLWTGCVPSKALIRSAHVAHVLKTSQQFGFSKANCQPEFRAVMDRMRRVRERISHHDSKEAIEKYGPKVIDGRAKFVSQNAVEVNGQILEARKFIIATGASQRIPKIEGLKEIGCLTHESIFELENQPRHLVIMGGGPVGVEFAQVFARLGTKVTIVEMLDRILPREEPETSQLLASILISENVSILTGHKVVRASRDKETAKIFVDGSSGRMQIDCDAVLVSTGKSGNTESLNLQACGVEVESGFVKVDLHQRTSVENIWACGDVCRGYQFTHYADHQARVAVMNACLRLPVKREMKIVPWCTFSEPEVASVGLREQEAVSRYGRERVFVLKYGLDDFDRAIIDDVATGFVKVCILKNGSIVGASIVADRAGEMIHEFAIAMKKKMKIQELAGMMHVYPTMSAAIGNASAQYYKVLAATGWQSLLLRKWVNLLK